LDIIIRYNIVAGTTKQRSLNICWLPAFSRLYSCGCMLQVLNAGELADIGFKPEWNSDPQLMGVYSVVDMTELCLL